MRIGSLAIYEQLKRAVQEDINEISEKNTMLFTGKKINKPSDDPVGAVRAIDYRVSIQQSEQYKSNMMGAGIFMSVADKAFTASADVLDKLINLANKGVNGDTPENRNQFSLEAAGYRDALLSMANTKFGGRHIFSGFKTDQQAFTFNAATNTYDYNGDLGLINVQIDKGMTIAQNVPGSNVFSFGLGASMSSVLSDGTTVSYTAALNPVNGVNTITIEIGNAGDPNHDTFSVSNVMDVANTISYAWKFQEVDGNALDASAAISKEKGLHRMDALSALADTARTKILGTQSEVGGRGVVLNDQIARTDQNILNWANARAKTEDADINQVFVELKQAEVALEALRSSSANVLSRSLFDYLK